MSTSFRQPLESDLIASLTRAEVSGSVMREENYESYRREVAVKFRVSKTKIRCGVHGVTFSQGEICSACRAWNQRKARAIEAELQEGFWWKL